MAVTFSRAERVPGADVLFVHGTTDQLTDAAGGPRPLLAQGWVSAVTNYYPPASYDGNGNLTPGAVPRAMTTPERLAYARQLLQAAEAAALAVGLSAIPAGTVQLF